MNKKGGIPITDIPPSVRKDNEKIVNTILPCFILRSNSRQIMVAFLLLELQRTKNEV